LFVIVPQPTWIARFSEYREARAWILPPGLNNAGSQAKRTLTTNVVRSVVDYRRRNILPRRMTRLKESVGLV